MLDTRSKNILGCRKKNRQAGFTLIEMFIVIAVIGILAGVVFRGTATIQSSARDTRRISDMRAVQNYLETYFFICGHYPGGPNCEVQSINTWDALAASLAGVKAISSADKLPKDPIQNRADGYKYGTSTDNLSYVIRATLESRNQVLDNDVDGTVFSLDCGASPETQPNWFYCLQP